MKRERLFILTGPTASGKSEIIAELSRKYPIEVLNADSRQVYKYMPIGTSQPTAEEQDRIKYHLVACVEPNELYSAGAFAKYCKKEIPLIQSRGNIPFVVGGTYFYIDALLNGLLDEPAIPDELKEEVNSLDADEVLRELKQKDPGALEKIHPNNLQRLKRALLISIAAGRPFSSFRREGGIKDQYDLVAWTLELPRETLYEKINLRTKKMMESGWLKEAQALLDKGYHPHSPGLKSVGYSEVICFLKGSGRGSGLHPDDVAPEKLASLTEKVAQKTRNFAKRQLVWLNGFSQKRLLKKIDHTQAKKNIDSHM